MATGTDAPTKPTEAITPPPQGAIDEVHRERQAATTTDRGTHRSGTTPQEIAFGGTADFQKLYGKDAVHRPVTDASAHPGAEPTNSEARESLLKAARDKFKNDPKALAAFQHDMDDFEKRMGKWPTLSSEIGHTYAQVERLLNGHSIEVSDKEKVKIAGELMHQLAKPQINQGNSEDCVAASLETRLDTRAPSQAARLVADMTLTGNYKTSDGRTITMDQHTIADYHPDIANTGQEPRSHASQIMQATLRNVELDRYNQEHGTNLRYEIRTSSGLLDNGERVIDYSKHPPQDVTSANMGMPLAHSDDVYDKVSGTKEQGFYLYFYNQQNGAEFKRKLDEMARDGKFPATIGVNLFQEPFMTEGGGAWASTGAALMSPTGIPMHAITINNYDPRTGQIEYTNHIRGSEVHTISRDDLLKAMYQPLLPGYTDKLADGINEAIKKDPSVKANVENNISTLLTFIQPDQRAQFIDELSAKTGIDLRAQLTRDERARLGLESGVLDFLSSPFHPQ